MDSFQYLTGIEPASNPDDGKDEGLLDEESEDHSEECRLRYEFYEYYVDKSHTYMGEKDQIVESQGRSGMFEYECKSFQCRFNDVAAFL